MEDSKDKDNIVAKTVVTGHEVRQTSEVRWLCLKDIYDHFQRPNFYDIGGTYMGEYPEFWFTYRTEQVCNHYILHLLVCNRQSGSFSISLPSRNQMILNDRSRSVQLMCNPLEISEYKYLKVSEGSFNHIATYSFDELDIDLMKGKILLIAFSIDTNPSNEQKIPISKARSLHDFAQLLADPVCADFTIESGDGHKFQAHKFLLASRSEVFKAMLKEDTAESINSHVKMVDIAKEDLSCLLEFIYTGTVKDLENVNCYNLLMLADRYNIKGLKDLVQHALHQHLCLENALEVLRAADMYNCGTLKTSAFKFIKQNISSIDTTIFREIQNLHLMQELCQYLAVRH